MPAGGGLGFGGQQDQPFDLTALLAMLPQMPTPMNPLAMLGIGAAGGVMQGIGSALFPSRTEQLQEKGMERRERAANLIENRVGQTAIQPQQYASTAIQNVLPDLRQMAERGQTELGIGAGQGFQHILAQFLGDYNRKSIQANQAAQMANLQAQLRRESMLLA